MFQIKIASWEHLLFVLSLQMTHSSHSISNSYEVSQSRDGTYGTLKDDGSWSGMLGMISAGFSDIGICDVYASEDRASVVDFLMPVEVSR